MELTNGHALLRYPGNLKSVTIMDKLISYGLPSILGFLLSFGSFTMENPVERSIYSVVAAAIATVLVRLIGKLPELLTAIAARKKSREDTLATANDKLIASLQASLDVARLRADTAEEAREIDRASKHLLQTYYGAVCNHLQYRGELLREAGVSFEDVPFADVLTLLKPHDEKIQALMSVKTAIAREVAGKSTSQAITLPDRA